ncbi:hypothetical protein [uncultured Microscilla sp.]|uniref:hypothetical protein n=1 Tax=uncultured Microscilla sp. TaxID=432653 RepID=UPI0026379B04|nr:hypothetical protein [uncultured Microscilla sp.]
MQFTELNLVAQNELISPKANVSLFEQGIRCRIEVFALNADALIEQIQKQDVVDMVESLELKLIELSHLLNDAKMLRDITQS